MRISHAASDNRSYVSGSRLAASAAGSGIGLSVVKSVIDAHGGELVLANRLQGGLRIEALLNIEGLRDVRTSLMLEAVRRPDTVPTAHLR